jgi:hypothetical protein
MKICQSITDKTLFYYIFSSTLTTAVDSKSTATAGDSLTTAVNSKSTATAGDSLTTIVDSKLTATTTSRLTMPKSYDHIRSGLVR